MVLLSSHVYPVFFIDDKASRCSIDDVWLALID